MTRALEDVAEPVTRLTATAAHQWPVIAVFAALPTVGLVQGPSYAGLIYGLAVVQLVVGVCLLRHLPVIDRQLGLIAAAFAAWCWASVAWSIDPARSAAAALQMTAILAGCLIFLAGPRLTGEAADRLFRVLFLATLTGGAVFIADRALGYPLQSLFMGRSLAPVATKYNRGLDHLVLIAWPQLAFFARRGDWRGGLLLAAGVTTIEGIGLSLAGQVGIMAGLIVLVLAYWLPRLVAPAIAGATIIFVAGLPFGLRALAEHRSGTGAVPEDLGAAPAGDLGLHDRTGPRAPAARLGLRHRWQATDHARGAEPLRRSARPGHLSAQSVARRVGGNRRSRRRHRTRLRAAGPLADTPPRRYAPAVRLCHVRVRPGDLVRQFRGEDRLLVGRRWSPPHTF